MIPLPIILDKDETLNSQNTPHISPSPASYEVSIGSILVKTDCVIMAPFYILYKTSDLLQGKWGHLE